MSEPAILEGKMFKNPITAPTLLSVFITAILYFGGVDIWWLAAAVTVFLLLVWFIVGEMIDAPKDPQPVLISDGPNRWDRLADEGERLTRYIKEN